MAFLRIALVNGYLSVLLLLAVYVRHWLGLVLWFALLAGLLIAPLLPISNRRAGLAVGFLSFLGWLVYGAAIAITTGQSMWAAFLAMGVVFANYLAYDWDRPLPVPSDPKSPAFSDPVFSVAVGGLLLSGVLVLLSLTNGIQSAWLGPACGASGCMAAILAVAMARWRIRS